MQLHRGAIRMNGSGVLVCGLDLPGRGSEQARDCLQRHRRAFGVIVPVRVAAEVSHDQECAAGGNP